jgi:hypothetical protein
LYPNPADEYVTISLPKSPDGGFKIVILDLNGKSCKSITYHPNTKWKQSILLDIQDLNKGVYIFQLKYNTFSTTKKLVII